MITAVLEVAGLCAPDRSSTTIQRRDVSAETTKLPAPATGCQAAVDGIDRLAGRGLVQGSRIQLESLNGGIASVTAAIKTQVPASIRSERGQHVRGCFAAHHECGGSGAPITGNTAGIPVLPGVVDLAGEWFAEVIVESFTQFHGASVCGLKSNDIALFGC
jgi:hypothetical protein